MKYLVDFYSHVTDNQIQDYLTENGYTLLKTWNNFEKVFLIDCPTAPAQSEFIENISCDETISISPLDIQELYFNPTQWSLKDPTLPQITFSTNQDKDWWKNYCLRNPEFEKETVTIARKGSKIPVYIMDSGNYKIKLLNKSFYVLKFSS
jgi:hypothetical protein